MMLSRFLLCCGLIGAWGIALADDTSDDVYASAGDQTSADPSVVDGSPAGAPSDPQADEAVVKARQLQASLQELIGVTPEQVRGYREAQTKVERAAAPRATVQSASSDVISVDLTPGSTAPHIVLMHGYVTAIEILDETGQPWPIVSQRIGDPAAVDAYIEGAIVATAPSDQAEGAIAPGVATSSEQNSFGNVITVNPLVKFTSTNLIVVLQGLSRPIAMVLSADEPSKTTSMVDRMTLLVGGSGPMARAEVIRDYSGVDAGDDLRRVLIGQSPTADAAEVLADLPRGMRAWLDGSELWVRTTSRILSPAPTASVAMGELRAYRLPYLPVIVLTGSSGRLENVSVPRSAGTGQRVSMNEVGR